jgi:predicted ferric reductase
MTDPTRPAGRPARDRLVERGALWLGLYLVLVTLPLFALLPGVRRPGGGFAWDFSMALGYAGLAMLGVQFVLTARFRRPTAPFGIDIVYYFHRYLAVAAVALVVAHYAILRFGNPAALGPADPAEAPRHMTAGRAAVLLFVALTLASLLRQRLRFEYDLWRATHAFGAALAFGLAFWHLLGSGHYLDSVWKRAVWIGYGLCWLLTIGYVRLVRPLRLLRSPWRVTEVRPERGRVWTLVLEPAERTPPLRFAPGQFAWLSLGSSPFAMREHPFSVASSAERPGRIELSIKELGDFTSTIGGVEPGAIAYVDAPYGTFGIDRQPAAEGYVFVAGGIGIAPLLSMLRTMADRGDGRPCTLFYGNRVLERVAFREELEALALRLDLRVVHVLLEPPPGWTGEAGFIDREVLDRHLPPARDRHQYYLCGPTPMTRSVEQSLAALGIPAAQVHSEIFDWV